METATIIILIIAVTFTHIAAYCLGRASAFREATKMAKETFDARH